MASGSVARSWFQFSPVVAQDDGTRSAELEIRHPIGSFEVNESEFIKALDGLGSVDSLTIRISSIGGDAFQGVSMFNAIRRKQAKVTVRVEAIAASAASVIAMAGDEIVMEPGSSMMIHQASSWAEGTAADMRAAMDMLATTDANMADIYAARSGLGSPADWLAAMAQTTWFSGEQAVAAGLATEAVGLETDDGDPVEAKAPTQAELARLNPVTARMIGEPTTAEAFIAALQPPTAADLDRGQASNHVASVPAAPVGGTTGDTEGGPEAPVTLLDGIELAKRPVSMLEGLQFPPAQGANDKEGNN